MSENEDLKLRLAKSPNERRIEDLLNDSDRNFLDVKPEKSDTGVFRDKHESLPVTDIDSAITDVSSKDLDRLSKKLFSEYGSGLGEKKQKENIENKFKSIIKANEKRFKEKKKYENVVYDSAVALITKENLTSQSINNVFSFQKKVQLKYYSKSLSLMTRTNLYLSSLVKLSRASAKILDIKLDAIKQNTGRIDREKRGYVQRIFDESEQTSIVQLSQQLDNQLSHRVFPGIGRIASKGANSAVGLYGKLTGRPEDTSSKDTRYARIKNKLEEASSKPIFVSDKDYKQAVREEQASRNTINFSLIDKKTGEVVLHTSPKATDHLSPDDRHEDTLIEDGDIDDKINSMGGNIKSKKDYKDLRRKLRTENNSNGNIGSLISPVKNIEKILIEKNKSKEESSFAELLEPIRNIETIMTDKENKVKINSDISGIRSNTDLMLSELIEIKATLSGGVIRTFETDVSGDALRDSSKRMSSLKNKLGRYKSSLMEKITNNPIGGILGDLKDIGVGSVNLSKNAISNVLSLSSNITKKLLSVPKGLFNFATKPMFNKEKYFDVYREDKFILGRPLVTKEQFEEGLVFEDGKKVKNTSSIDRPVIDPDTGNTLITIDDIQAGLVNYKKKPISKRKMSFVGLAARGLKNLVFGSLGLSWKATKGTAGLMGTVIEKMFSASATIVGGMLNAIPAALGAAGKVGGVMTDLFLKPLSKLTFHAGKSMIDLSSFMIKGLGKGIGRALGFDIGSTKKYVNDDSLKNYVTDPLDKIYDLLKEMHKKRDPDDKDGDGLRDFSARDIYRRREARRAKLRERDNRKKQRLAGLIPGVGAGVGMMSLLGGKRRDRYDDDDDDREDDYDNDNEYGGIIDTIKDTAVGYATEEALDKVGDLFSRRGRRGRRGRSGGSRGSRGRNPIRDAARRRARRAGSRAGSRSLLRSGAAIATTAGKSLAKKIPGLGILAGLGFAADRAFDGDLTGGALEALSGLAGATGIGLPVSLAIDGYLLKRDIDKMKEETEDSDMDRLITKQKLIAYGFTEVDATKEEIHEAINSIEYLFSHGMKKLTEAKEIVYKEFAPKLVKALGKKDADIISRQALANWYAGKFVPVYSAYKIALADMGRSEEDIEDFTSLEAKEFIPKFTNAIEQVSAYGNANLTPYDFISKGKENTEPLIPIGGSKTANIVKASLPIANTLVASTSNNFHSFQQGRSKFSKTSNDNKPRKYNSNTHYKNSLHAISAKYESGKAGSRAIGYDRNGGTSYGKYQISSRQGTMDAFLKWMSKGDAHQKKVAEELRASGRSNTGNTKGAFPETWKRLAASGDLKDYEEQFIKMTHYDAALKKLPEAAQKQVNENIELQQALWSTSVQHGAGGGAKIFRNTFEGGNSVPEYLEKIYTARGAGKNWKNSTEKTKASVRKRFGNELDSLVGGYESRIAEQRSAKKENIVQAHAKMESVASEKENALIKELVAASKENNQAVMEVANVLKDSKKLMETQVNETSKLNSGIGQVEKAVTKNAGPQVVNVAANNSTTNNPALMDALKPNLNIRRA